MTYHIPTAAVTAALCALLVVPAAWAQRDDDDDGRRFGLALGGGVVEPDDAGEIYYHAALRYRLSDRDEPRDDDDWRYVDRGDIQAHIEPEIGYWERDDPGFTESDLTVGVNAIGVVPGRAVDYFFGVGLGLHFLDTQIDVRDPDQPDIDESDEHFGGNFQVGLDIHLGESASLFGAGRFDVIEGLDETLQGKVYMGFRFRF
ncbi:MAG: hypothetical protein ACLF0P_02130 [Thermoanaerobaculia bacterium]